MDALSYYILCGLCTARVYVRDMEKSNGYPKSFKWKCSCGRIGSIPGNSLWMHTMADAEEPPCSDLVCPSDFVKNAEKKVSEIYRNLK